MRAVLEEDGGGGAFSPSHRIWTTAQAGRRRPSAGAESPRRSSRSTGAVA
uniref:Uncharacterized protein n=1 Tax=Arundo donax TaxID=35708 RepID=A0A0A9EC58_ARUDO